MSSTVLLEGIEKLRRDLRVAATELGDREARFLVDGYYVIQGHRIEAQGQVRALTADEEPNAVLAWLFEQHHVLEREIAKALDVYSDAQEPGRWARSILGIGPVLAAGLLAHIDIEQAPTVGHIWRFAGLDPTSRWERGQKRPWNAALKVLTWKIGESFVKVSGRPCRVGAGIREGTSDDERADLHEGTETTERAVPSEGTEPIERAEPDESTVIKDRSACLPGCGNYGHVYLHRKAQEIERNEAGLFRDQAERTLAEKKIGKATDAYKAYAAGKLPAARIHARAKRYAVKLFLAHYHHVAFESRFGEPPPKPYVISQLGHTKFIGPPNWPMEGAD